MYRRMPSRVFVSTQFLLYYVGPASLIIFTSNTLGLDSLENQPACVYSEVTMITEDMTLETQLKITIIR